MSFKILSSIIFCFTSCIILSQDATDSLLLVKSIEIHFESNKSYINSEDSTVLSQLVDSSQSIVRYKMVVSAHTDADGSEEYNRELSLERTNAVIRILEDLSVDTANIHSSFYGESIPIASNNEEDGKQRNRRATVELRRPVKFFNISVKLVDDESGKVLNDAHLSISTQEGSATIGSDKDSLYTFKLPPSVVFRVEASAQNYLPTSMMSKVTPEITREFLEIRLSPLKAGSKFDLERLHFVGSKAILLEGSKPELDKLFQFMSINESVCVEIIGHVNWPNRSLSLRGSHEFNLSIARSRSIYENLIDRGIDSIRMFYTGRGNSEMLFPKAKSSIHQQKNRRVEISVTTCEESLNDKSDSLEQSKYDTYLKRRGGILTD